jgi:hypothetical protein
LAELLVFFKLLPFFGKPSGHYQALDRCLETPLVNAKLGKVKIFRKFQEKNYKLSQPKEFPEDR